MIAKLAPGATPAPQTPVPRVANATPAAITEKVKRYLDMGFTTVLLPADIYPPARIENIEAFVRAIQEYAG